MPQVMCGIFFDSPLHVVLGLRGYQLEGPQCCGVMRSLGFEDNPTDKVFDHIGGFDIEFFKS